MFKRKQQSSMYSECVKRINEEGKVSSKQEDYKELAVLYNNIKDNYKEEIENGELDLYIEKAKIENERLICDSKMLSYKKYPLILLISLVIAIYLQSIGFLNVYTGIVNTSLEKLIDLVLKAVALGTVFSSLYYLKTSRTRKEEKLKQILNLVKLVVIEELVLEKLQEKLQEKIEIKLEELNLEKQEYSSESGKGSMVADILMPAAVEVAASILKKDGILRRLIRKIKR